MRTKCCTDNYCLIVRIKEGVFSIYGYVTTFSSQQSFSGKGSPILQGDDDAVPDRHL